MSNSHHLVPFARLPMRRRDQDFLPAALQILETPASPITAVLTLVICALAATAIGWAYCGKIDIIAVASGKFQPSGRVKVIQPVETGKVVAVYATNGSHVAAGDILVELDRTEVQAEEMALAADLASVEAEAVCRSAALEAARADQPIHVVAWPSDMPPALRLREERVLAADLRQLGATLSSWQAQLLQKRAEAESLSGTIKAEKDLIATLQDRVDMKAQLVALDAGTKANLLDATETLRLQFTTLATQEGQLLQAQAGAAVIEQEIEKARDGFAADNSQKLADAQRQIEDLEQKLVKARSATSHMTIRSPVAGTVQGSMLTTIGQVVSTGTDLMRIVPDGATLEIEAYLDNKDIGFVEAGQEATVKVESFPFTQYGSLTAHVVRVATDAVPEPDARMIEGGATKAGPSETFAGAQKMQNLVFPVTLQADRTTVNADGRLVPLGPGMSVSVEIKTGRRRILEYLFSPLVEVTSQALKER